MKYLEIKLFKCKNNTSTVECKPQQVIDEYLAKESFSFAFVNSMFVASDYENPIQTFIDD